MKLLVSLFRGIILGAILSGAAAPIAQQVAASVPVTSVAIVPSPDGTLDGHYQAGDKPPTFDALAWDIADALITAGWDQLLVGTSKNTDIRQYLSGTNAAAGDSTITLLSVSGTALATAGISITSSCGTGAGSCLSYDGVGGPAAGTFRVVATDVAGSTQSTVKSFTITNPASVPGQVTGVQATVNSSTAITVSWAATSGATSYKAYRDGDEIATDITDLFYQHTGLSASTQYSFTVKGTNGTGDGTASAAVLATTSGPLGELDPDYPRLYLRQAMSNMRVLDVTGSLTDFNTAACHIARFHAGMFTGTRGSTFGGGAYHVGDYINAVKACDDNDAGTTPEYLEAHPDGLTAFVKYTNNTQIGNGTSAEEVFLKNKVTTETNGEGDWVLRNDSSTCTGCTATKGQPLSNQSSKWLLNFYSLVDGSDLDTNSPPLNWASWYPRFWYAAGSAAFTDNLAAGDWSIGSGHGISEGAWDGIFLDDQSIREGQAIEVDAADKDENGSVTADDDNDDPDMIVARSEGFVSTVSTWRTLFDLDPDDSMKYVLGNVAVMQSHSEIWPANMKGLYNGGLAEETTGKTKTRLFGNYTTNDSATQPYTGVLGMYRRLMENMASPRVVAIGHENGSISNGQYVSEFRVKWGCKPGSPSALCGATPSNPTGVKPQSWISEGGSCANTASEGQSTTAPAKCKYPGHATGTNGLSDWRLLRWALAFVMMDDGYLAVNQQSPTWDTGIPWYDEYVGGSQVNAVGWCGQPVAGATGDPQRAAWEGGVWMREFQNCIVFHNPPRNTPTTDQTKTGIDLPAAGAGFRWKHLCAAPNGYTTDGNSGVQDAVTNDGSWVGTENESGLTITVKQFDAVYLWRAPIATTLSCPT